jgi:hypothetical protein
MPSSATTNGRGRLRGWPDFGRCDHEVGRRTRTGARNVVVPRGNNWEQPPGHEEYRVGPEDKLLQPVSHRSVGMAAVGKRVLDADPVVRRLAAQVGQKGQVNSDSQPALWTNLALQPVLAWAGLSVTLPKPRLER